MEFRFIDDTGVVAALWMVVGVYLAGKIYGQYSHVHQLCSELGARSAVTEKISPIINNYPLALLFCLFGLSVWMGSSNSLVAIIGALIMLHGLATGLAGYFPMDVDPYTTTPSKACQIHSLSGLMMFLSLTLAPGLLVFSDFGLELKMFSIVCLMCSLFFTYRMAKAYQSRENLGLYQRLSYGFQLLWLAGFSVYIAG